MSRNKIFRDKTQIVDGAFAIMDAEGAEALSIRRLAKDVGVSSMTIYNYVRNIDDIGREILMRSFKLLFADVYAIMQRAQREEQSGIAAFARAYAFALYAFASEHRHICTYLIGKGRAAFHCDAELRPFYNTFDGFLLNVPDSAAGKQLKCACHMYESMLFSMVYEYAAGIRPLTAEMLEYTVDLFLSNLFPGEDAAK